MGKGIKGDREKQNQNRKEERRSEKRKEYTILLKVCLSDQLSAGNALSLSKPYVLRTDSTSVRSQHKQASAGNKAKVLHITVHLRRIKSVEISSFSKIHVQFETALKAFHEFITSLLARPRDIVVFFLFLFSPPRATAWLVYVVCSPKQSIK